MKKHGISKIALTSFSILGLTLTTVTAVRATPKAISIIEEAKREKKNVSKMDIVAKTWKCYIPSATIGMSTIACILGMTVLYNKQYKALAAAYAMCSCSYQEYKDMVKQLYGQEVHEKIMKSIAAEQSEKTHISSMGIIRSSSLDFDDGNKDEQKLFYDCFSKRYFQSTVSQVLQAQYHINRNYVLSGEVTVNDFYEFLGISAIDAGNDLTWRIDDDEIYWIDFNNYKADTDDGLECYVIDMVIEPYFHND